MPNFIYAVFKAANEAEVMSTEMVELGGNKKDLTVIALPPFGSTDTMPSDLVGRLQAIGIGESTANDLQTVVLAGGALLISSTPTGDITDTQAWRLISRCGGTQMGRSETVLALN